MAFRKRREKCRCQCNVGHGNAGQKCSSHHRFHYENTAVIGTQRSNALHSCYASCERVFRPDLAKVPIVVLPKNDGCVIARRYDAKPFVKMGDASIGKSACAEFAVQEDPGWHSH